MPTYQYVLVGPRAGKTENLGGHQFKDGVYLHESKYKLNESGDLTNYLARCWNAHPAGTQELAEAQQAWEDLKAETPAPVRGVVAATGQQLTDDEVRKLIDGLDPDDDSHWAGNGTPSVEAVSKAAGFLVARKAITKAAPGFTRDSARALA